MCEILDPLLLTSFINMNNELYLLPSPSKTKLCFLKLEWLKKLGKSTNETLIVSYHFNYF